ncbi:MAG TPA: UDP-N-acetylglucosamine--N-acetylmuramyl-(pentapeptide) pyrophosphoryl-undecaprenol N-acetylglucosamine transferase [Patescibacteria group bacterium]|jgi:UDP-N-acetylglucosamine--N-acetylmuramyl-(pentapeptide) pyrophosphoryl-undecaprenol N-acetylglucosamine transferase|nr:UDP-N-acetylglucosamine--N-acetylmuramyl-(pentapeptide) pyrophosphoryl-undecaprenol N-acetylglucosamine transferase [Patescibacteria group bacterium]
MNITWQKNLILSGFPGDSKKTIVFAAGKSGGHIVPCLTIAAAEKKKNATTRNIFFTTTSSLDKTIIASNQIVVDMHKPIELMHLPRTWYEYGSFIWHFCSSFFTALYVFFDTKPSCIISTGGIVALPICLAGYCLRIPIHLYELNATPGNAISKLAPLAHSVHCCFHGLDDYFPTTKVIHTQYPIRYQTQEITKNCSTARQALHLDPDKTTITILGGSQGSQFINQILDQITSIDTVYWRDIQFIHQTGHKQVAEVKKLYQQKNITAHVFDYSPNLSEVYAAADLVIGRAGAGTIFETAAFKKPCILIPLETCATDHQLLNAYSIVKQIPELFSLLRQDDLTTNPLLLTYSIQSLLKKRS